jgi:hypothetical protein
MEQHGECHDKDRCKPGEQVCTCGSTDVARVWHAPTFALPECWFWYCHECEHEWGHS